MNVELPKISLRDLRMTVKKMGVKESFLFGLKLTIITLPIVVWIIIGLAAKSYFSALFGE